MSNNQLSSNGSIYEFQGHITKDELSTRNNANAQAAEEEHIQNENGPIKTDVIAAKESPGYFANRHGITFDQLLKLNGMEKETYEIVPGQTLRVK